MSTITKAKWLFEKSESYACYWREGKRRKNEGGLVAEDIGTLEMRNLQRHEAKHLKFHQH